MPGMRGGDQASRDDGVGHWRDCLYLIIFKADTPFGRGFDLALLLAILLSVVAVCLETVDTIHASYRQAFFVVEWIFTAVFTVEYILRLVCVRRPLAYARSFFGVVDLLAVLPTYLSLVVPGAQSLLVIRILRLLRVFRVLKLGRFVGEGQVLLTAMRNSRHKIIVFLFAVLSLVVIIGATMFLVEGPSNGFTSIPRGMYWAIVTVTTVGYGDISPQTVAGQILASLLMIAGYGIIAVPTGIVTAELTQVCRRDPVTTRTCPSCMAEGHTTDARFCLRCGAPLEADGDATAQ